MSTLHAILVELSSPKLTDAARLRLAEKAIATAPERWEGYYHRAHARFWTRVHGQTSFQHFFSELSEIIADVETVRTNCPDQAKTAGLELELFSNLAQIASHQSVHGFTGKGIENVVRILLLCASKLPENPTVESSKRQYGEALVQYAATSLERAVSQGGAHSKPPETHLEYLYFSWKLLGVTTGLKRFREFAAIYLRNSFDEDYKTVLRDQLDEVSRVATLS